MPRMQEKGGREGRREGGREGQTYLGIVPSDVAQRPRTLRHNFSVARGEEADEGRDGVVSDDDGGVLAGAYRGRERREESRVRREESKRICVVMV